MGKLVWFESNQWLAFWKVVLLGLASKKGSSQVYVVMCGGIGQNACAA